AASGASGAATWRITCGSVYRRQYNRSSEDTSLRRCRRAERRSPRTSALLVDRAPQVGARAGVVALVEEVAEVDARLAEQRLEEAPAVEPEQPCRHLAPILGRDAAVVGTEHLRLGAEDRHVAVEEMACVVGKRIVAEI